jgi:hypothetical protein
MVVYRSASRLKNIDVFASNVFVDFDKNLAIAKPTYSALAKLSAKTFDYILSQRAIRTAGKEAKSHFISP